MNKHILRDVAIWLACGSGLLYILGQSYYSSWLGTLGLSSSFLPKDTPQILQMGFAPFYTYGLWAFILLFPVLGLLKFLASVSFKLLAFFMRKLMPNFYKELTSAWDEEVEKSAVKNDVSHNSDSDSDSDINILDFVITNLFFVFLLALLYVFLGSWRAVDKVEDIYSKKETIYRLKADEMSIITCSSVTSLCAIHNYTNKQTEIIKLESLASASIVSKPKGLYEIFNKESHDKKI